MVKVFLGIGSNIDPKSKNLRDALKIISNFTKINRVSSVYKSVSLLRDAQDDYFNIVIDTTCDFAPDKLLKVLKSVEKKLGRKDAERWSSRIIDIDILDYNNEIIESEHLKIPHPEMQKRSFVLYPLKEINPDYIHPILKMSVDELISKLDDDLNIKKIGDLHWL